MTFITTKSVEPNKPNPIIFVKLHQELNKSFSKPMAEYNSDDLKSRMFLLPPNQKGERQRASITRGNRNLSKGR